MKGLLLIAHGSRLSASNEEFKSMVDELRAALSSDYAVIQAAYLELCEPGISTAIDAMVAAGVDDLTVFPYFLNQGRHVREDVPNEVAEKQSEYAQVKFNLLPYFGKSPQIKNLIISLLAAELP